jgi:co-chaperonin GroES (HSP10)
MIRPMGNKVVVKPLVRQLSSVLIVKNTEPFNEGTVVATGPKATEISVGDFIKYGNGDYLKWPTPTA